MDFSNLFSNGKSGGPGPPRVDRAARLESTMDQGGTDKRVQRRLTGARALALAGAHHRWQRGGTMEAKNGGDLSSVHGRWKARRSLGESGKRGGEGQGF
jgi:hypothetical protein